jgi:hypothetical protein
LSRIGAGGFILALVDIHQDLIFDNQSLSPQA